MVKRGARPVLEQMQIVKCSKTGLVQFSSLETEKVYRVEASAALYDKVKYVRRIVLPLTVIAVAAYAFSSGRVHIFSGSFWDLTLRFEPYVAFDLAFALAIALCLLVQCVLHCSTKTSVEHQTCGVVTLGPFLLLFVNPLRLHRVRPEWFPLYESLITQGDSCDLDSLEVSLDTRIIAWGLLSWLLLAGVFPVRANIQFIWASVLFSLSCCVLFLHPLKPNDSLYTQDARSGNITLLICGSLSLCYVTYLHDWLNRETWALQQASAGRAKKLEALLTTLCPAVVHVREEQISPVSAVEDMFGERVATLLDLPTQDARESLSDEVRDMLDEVRASGGPAKRKVMIRPRGGTEVFLSTVCAVVDDESLGALVGFEVHDSWTITSAITAPQQDVSRGSDESEIVRQSRMIEALSLLECRSNDSATGESRSDESMIGEGLKRVLFDAGSSQSGRERKKLS